MLNRRNIIGGAAALPAIAIASYGATASASASTLSPDFAAVLADAAAVNAALIEHDKRVYAPAKARADALIAALPHTTVHAGPSLTGGEVVWSTDKPNSIAVARSIVNMARKGRDMAGAGDSYARALLAAHLRRERAASRIYRDTGCSAAVQRSNQLGNAWVDAQGVVGRHPVRTAADLAAKLAFMIKNDMEGDGMAGNGGGWLEILHADARRVAGREG
ncbi:hypothetical protein [Sphingomonas sp. DC2300-3]|uniref:hypothetical protein n=1 Tax=unclassified Sphingomonas TaxID=196159 RepID=UPI003CF23638